MLSFTIHKLGDTALFRCAGRFVSGDIENLRDAIRTQWRAGSVVLDLAQIEDIDAAGMGTLVSLRAWAQASGITFKLMNLKPRVEVTLELAHLRARFEVCSVAEMLDLLCHAIKQSPRDEPVVGILDPLPEPALSTGRIGPRH